MRVAVVGGGIFGCTAAVDLARVGHRVDLLERHEELLMGASRCNQGRLHYGYHYPRSAETARLTAISAPLFNARFPGATDWRNAHYYAIARENSLTGADAYLRFLRELDLEYEVDVPEALDAATIDLAILAPEALINIQRLREILIDDLDEAGVDIHLDTLAAGPALPGYDIVVDATYGRWWPQPLQREMCEIAVVRLPAEFRDLSLVILDGPFLSVDPLPDTDLHLLYHVEQSVHRAEVSGIANGDVPPSRSNAPAMVEALRHFCPAGRDAQYVSSMFATRAVLPGVESTDERPTLVQREGNVISILSGKIDTAVVAAQRVVALAAG